MVSTPSTPKQSCTYSAKNYAFHNFLMPTTIYILTCMGKVLVLNVHHSFEWTHHARSGLPLDDNQHLASYILLCNESVAKVTRCHSSAFCDVWPTRLIS